MLGLPVAEFAQPVLLRQQLVEEINEQVFVGLGTKEFFEAEISEGVDVSACGAHICWFCQTKIQISLYLVRQQPGRALLCIVLRYNGWFCAFVHNNCCPPALRQGSAEAVDHDLLLLIGQGGIHGYADGLFVVEFSFRAVARRKAEGFVKRLAVNGYVVQVYPDFFMQKAVVYLPLGLAALAFPDPDGV